MKQTADILDRVAYLKDKMLLLNTLKTAEMDKPINRRDYKLLEFLWKERSVYTYAIREFEWLLDINEG